MPRGIERHPVGRGLVAVAPKRGNRDAALILCQALVGPANAGRWPQAPPWRLKSGWPSGRESSTPHLWRRRQIHGRGAGASGLRALDARARQAPLWVAGRGRPPSWPCSSCCWRNDAAIEYSERGRLRTVPADQAPSPETVLTRLLHTHRHRFRSRRDASARGGGNCGGRLRAANGTEQAQKKTATGIRRVCWIVGHGSVVEGIASSPF